MWLQDDRLEPPGSPWKYGNCALTIEMCGPELQKPTSGLKKIEEEANLTDDGELSLAQINRTARQVGIDVSNLS